MKCALHRVHATALFWTQGFRALIYLHTDDAQPNTNITTLRERTIAAQQAVTRSSSRVLTHARQEHAASKLHYHLRLSASFVCGMKHASVVRGISSNHSCFSASAAVARFAGSQRSMLSMNSKPFCVSDVSSASGSAPSVGTPRRCLRVDGTSLVSSILLYLGNFSKPSHLPCGEPMTYIHAAVKTLVYRKTSWLQTHTIATTNNTSPRKALI